MSSSRRLAAFGGSMALALGLAACGGSQDPAGGSTSPDESASSSASPSSAGSFTDADVTFAQMMIIHHRSALLMSEMAAESAESADVRDLAQRISMAQGPEIETMSSWLEQWGEDVPEGTSTEGMGGMDDGGMDMGGTDTGGTDTDDAMTELDGQSGADFDRMFLEMMIEHHEGAVDMSADEIAEGQNPDAIALAESITASQNAEIAEMQEILRGL